MLVHVTPAQLDAMLFLAQWALRQPTPPISVMAAADCVGSFVITERQSKEP